MTGMILLGILPLIWYGSLHDFVCLDLLTVQ